MVRIVRFAVAALFLVSAQVIAADYDLGPSDFSKLGTGSSVRDGVNVRHSLGGVVRFPGGKIPSFNVTRNQIVPVSGVASGLKELVRINPGAVAASAALAALFAGIDWVMDEGALVRTGETDAPPEAGYLRWYAQRSGRGFYGATPLSSCTQLAASFGWTVSGSPSPVSSTRMSCVAVLPGGGDTTLYADRSGTDCPPGSSYSSTSLGCVTYQPVPVQDSDWPIFNNYFDQQPATAIANTGGLLVGLGISPADMSITDDVIDGPAVVVGDGQTSTTTDSQGNTTVTNTSTGHNFEYSPTTVTHTGDTVSTDTYVNGNLSTSTTTNTSSANTTVQASEVPTDCEFMPTLCAWLEWFKTPTDMPDPEFPEIGEFDDDTDDFTVQFSSSCPEPYYIDLTLFPPVTFSWQPLCTFAGYLKPMVIISALIFASYISLGISRGTA